MEYTVLELLAAKKAESSLDGIVTYLSIFFAKKGLTGIAVTVNDQRDDS